MVWYSFFDSFVVCGRASGRTYVSILFNSSNEIFIQYINRACILNGLFETKMSARVADPEFQLFFLHLFWYFENTMKKGDICRHFRFLHKQFCAPIHIPCKNTHSACFKLNNRDIFSKKKISCSFCLVFVLVDWSGKFTFTDDTRKIIIHDEKAYNWWIFWSFFEMASLAPMCVQFSRPQWLSA